MASLALGAAGALVGSFFGPLGASIGWAIGSAAGAALFAKGQQGPRLTDLKLQSSSYGQMIPLIYGTVRIAGNVIWQTDLKEHQQKTGGKGGPTVTTYTYSASYAVAICEGPILGIKSIWANSRLVYQPAGGVSGDNFPFTLYLGDETQLADPTIEATEGVGNVNGNRGVAYVVFTDQFLTDYGNVIPSLTFEVFTASQPIPWRYAAFTAPNSSNRAGNGGVGPQSGAIEGGRLIVSTVAGTTNTPIVAQPCGFSLDAYDLTTGAFIENLISTSAPPAGGSTTTKSNILQCLNNPHVMLAYHSERFTGDITHAFYYDGEITAQNLDGGAFFPAFTMLQYGNDAIYSVGGNATADLNKWAAPGGAVLNPDHIATYALPGHGSAYTLAIDLTTGDVWASRAHVPAYTGDELFRLDKDLNLIASWPFSDVPQLLTIFPGNEAIQTLVVFNKILVVNSTYSAAQQCECWAINDDNTFTKMSHNGTLPGEQTDSGHYPFLGNIISLGNGLIYSADGIVSLEARPAGAILSDIVADLSHRSGLADTQLDVSELIDIVDGYVISQQAPTRAMIEPLQTAYFFDAVESDTLAKFVKRGKGSEVTIPNTDLGAFASGGTPPPLITPTRVQEVDLPRIITASYFNEDAAYQIGTQIAQRLITSSEVSVSLQLAIVMNDAKAKQIVDGNLFNAWLERDKVVFLTPTKWTYLEPTDVVTAGGYRVRITDKNETVAGVISFQGVVTAPYVFEQAAVSVPGLAPPPPPPPGAVTNSDLLMLDVPLIVDTDFPNGYYAAMDGSVAGAWPGAGLYKSADGGVNFTNIAASAVADEIGVTASTLGPFLGGNCFDEINSVDIVMNAGAGDLASAPYADVLNGANACLIGSEILQFKNAVLTSAKHYTLSGFIRGRRGTEWAQASHVSGEHFVMLPTQINVDGPFAEIGAPRDFKAVTSGQAITAATDVPFTNNGIALRCYSPTHIGGGLNAAGDLAITWARRTRIGGAWQNLVDVPLSEAAEAYVVQIWNSTFTLCARVITGLTTPTATYTSAQQVTDFGAQQQTIYVTVGQIGTIGLGVQQSAALQGAGSTIDAPLSPVPPYNSGPSPPVPGSCVGTVFNDTATFAVGDARVTSPPGFVAGTNWVVKLTTPASGDYIGTMNFFEFGGPPCPKSISLSTGACGAPLIPAAAQSGPPEVSVGFTVGKASYPSLYANLLHATDYYFSMQTTCGGDSAYELRIFNN